jgi:hypothetical protein
MIPTRLFAVLLMVFAIAVAGCSTDEGTHGGGATSSSGSSSGGRY